MGLGKSMKDKVSSIAIGTIIDQAVKYIHKDPQNNFEKITANLGKLESLFSSSGGKFTKFLGWANANPGSKQWFIELLSRDENQVRTFMKNMFVNISLGWMDNNEELMEKHGITAPYTILISPTMRCNLRCQGCYAGEYAQQGDLSADELRRIIKEAKSLGTFFFT
ncbi:MAG TPA: hypothetical protein PKW46_05800, partial [Thermotogota bacterium]|nr:hypothetical protein [Thermotogota bacterium]